MNHEGYTPGDVLARHIGQDGKRRYIRVGDPGWDHPDHVWVQDCDGAGFLLDGRGRWLRESTLRTRYRVHYRQQADA